MTAQIKRTQGAIGYVEYTYAQQNKLSVAALQNKAGQFVVPDQQSVAKALDSQTLPPDLAPLLQTRRRRVLSHFYLHLDFGLQAISR